MNTKRFLTVLFTALATMIIMSSCQSEKDKRQEANDRVIEELQEFVEATDERIQLFGENINDDNDHVLDEIEESIERHQRKLEDHYDDFSDNAKKKADQISNDLEDLRDKIRDNFQSSTQKVTSYLAA